MCPSGTLHVQRDRERYIERETGCNKICTRCGTKEGTFTKYMERGMYIESTKGIAFKVGTFNI